VIYSYPGLTPPSSLLTTIRAGQCAGVIFFGENISSTTQIASVIDDLRTAQMASPIAAPLLLMTDQEGGQVRRLPGGPASSEKTIGSSSNPTGNAAAAGTTAAQVLQGVGMNVNLAPVLDVYYTAGDFIDEYQRSYSNNAGTVSSCGQAFIKAQQALDVAATAKHFPGLGAATATQNTDTGPVTLTQSLTQLRNVDEYPYQAAIAAGVKLIMVSWAVYTALDSANPAGFSSTVVRSELRSRLGFTGVTCTDALEAGAISSSLTTSQRAVRAATAGMDLILCSARSTSQGDSAATALANAYGAGTLPSADFNAAVNRVTALRNALA
jgi:beta-N-acetylhexosaminidase